VEITRLLTPGQNSVTFEARKLTQGARKSFSPDHSFVVVVGEGDAGGDNVMINNPLVTFKKTAADAESSSRDFSFTTR
jgi:NAD(P)H-hydrate repair Nnr-like enzyme with NAD(P)H-hydrate epimerase domain